MSSINFKQPVRPTDESNYVFSDIHLDIQEDKSTARGSRSDIKADYDIYAIRNSIRNIFNTRKGERILNPEFGVSLEQYLFEPLNTTIGHQIGTTIQEGIQAYEPRVTILSINVILREDFPGYQVDIVLFIPKLNINTIINTAVTQGGFNII